MGKKLKYEELESLATDLYKQLEVMRQFVTDNHLQGELNQYLEDNVQMDYMAPESLVLLSEQLVKN